ncbi:MAG: hypothetical protein HY245_15660 [Rhizobiales bacterium]|nr:hypothetical protein [Hyphomicrobiales bacterium]MBI3674822.1 hypothetical protein [Hyphomicrobiales bacterium]
MAEHAPSGSHMGDMEAHRATYRNFVKGAIVLSLVSFYILVALVSFRFANSLNVFTGFVGLIAGFIAIAIDVRAGGRWILSLGLLVVFAIVTAFKVSS